MCKLTNNSGIVLTQPQFISPKRYDNIVIDPPWPTIWKSNAFTGKNGLQYESMSIQQISALPITQLLKDDAWVFLWTTCSMLEDAFKVVRSWDLQFRQIITWNKDYGMGRPPFTATEHCLMCAYGEPPRPLMNGTQLLNHFSTQSVRLKHSQKPDEFFNHILPFTSGKDNLEMFARSSRVGWDSWGNEISQPVGTTPATNQ